MNCGIVLYTSTKGHFGYKNCYQETVERLEREFPSSNALAFPSNYPLEKFAHIKVSPDEDDIAEEMEKFFRKHNFYVLKTKAEWSHNDASHANGYYADKLTCFSHPEVLKHNTVLFIEDDWLIETTQASMHQVVRLAEEYLHEHPEKLCVRINRDTDKVPDWFKATDDIFVQGDKATPYGPTMTFQPTFVRPREWYHALRVINNSIKAIPNLLEQYHCELISGITMKDMFTDDPHPFCFFNPDFVTAEHIGDEHRCKESI
jgi:hypothetical protein